MHLHQDCDKGLLPNRSKLGPAPGFCRSELGMEKGNLYVKKITTITTTAVIYTNNEVIPIFGDIKEGTIYTSNVVKMLDATNQFRVLLLSHSLGVKQHGLPSNSHAELSIRNCLTWWVSGAGEFVVFIRGMGWHDMTSPRKLGLWLTNKYAWSLDFSTTSKINGTTWVLANSGWN